MGAGQRALEAGETLLDGALREVREEVGPALRVRPLGIVHASTFSYDALLPRVIGITYLMAHEGGDPVPDDDMRGSRHTWATPGEIESRELRLLPPLDQAWLRLRTLELFRLWQPAQDVPLQGPLTEPGWNKADHLS